MARSPARLGEYRRKRDFTSTSEPAGGATASDPDALRFVIQKHAATRLHFDFRLELDGVMKSWAVPKGPSLDPAVKRLAMEVEDHPIEYNTFEGTIPRGQYGGGTVMLWDRGTYEAGGDDAADGVTALRRGYREGNLKLFLHGERLEGGFALVRMRGREPSDKPQWLLIKERDEWVDRERDIVAEVETSVESGRTMDAIARRPGRVWQSNRDEPATAPARGGGRGAGGGGGEGAPRKSKRKGKRAGAGGRSAAEERAHAGSAARRKASKASGGRKATGAASAARKTSAAKRPAANGRKARRK